MARKDTATLMFEAKKLTGLNQKQMAAILDMPESTLCGIGKRDYLAPAFRKLTDRLGLDVEITLTPQFTKEEYEDQYRMIYAANLAKRGGK